MRTSFLAGMVTVLMVATSALADAAAPVKKVPSPGPNQKDEPLAKQFSMARAVAFLDKASLNWQQAKNCFTCHTNYAYLYARPALSAKSAAHTEIRQALEELVNKRWAKEGPRWDAEVVASAAALAYNDAAGTGKLHPATRTALDRMWTVQRKDGGWNWLKCNWPPMENDDHYGATLAAIAAGVAPDHYAKTDNAQTGLANLRRYFQANPPQNLHHKAMLLWASTYLKDMMTEKDAKATIEELLSRQLADGGWSSAGMGQWKRADKKEQDLKTSDGYGTGFTIFVLRRAGVPATDAALQRGLGWLKTHQRQSGRWFTRSLNSDNKHYLTHAGTAFAVMALAACEEKLEANRTSANR